MNAIVAGASGLVGKELVNLLLQDEDVRSVTVYVRKPWPSAHEKLRVIQGELAELSAHRDQLKGDVYFCALGTTIRTAGSQENFRKVDFFGVLSFARIAFQHKGRLIVVSASGADAQSKIFYNRVKGETEKALKDIGLHSLTILRPGLLLGNREEKRPGEKFAINAFGILRHLVPEKLERKIATPVLLLSKRMVEEAKAGTPGTRIIEAQDI